MAEKFKMEARDGVLDLRQFSGKTAEFLRYDN
jgi:hypothetical protein